MFRSWLRLLARQLRRPSPAGRRHGGQLHGRRAAPRLERLEDRTTPSTLDFTSGILTYTASSNVASNFTISLSGTTYTLSDTAEKITVTAAAQAAGFKGNGTNTVTGPDGNSLTAIDITLGGGNDTANVRSFSKPTTLTTGAGSDTINVCSSGLTGNLNGIGANLTIDAGAGANTLNVSNFSATSGDGNVVIGNSQITGFAGSSGASVISYAATGGSYGLLHVLGANSPRLAQKFTVNSPNATLFQLDAENGTNTINVEATGNTANINGGLGNDSINVNSSADLSGSLDNIKGTLNIDGGHGSNTLTVSDAGESTASSVTISATQITGFAGSGHNQTINYKAVGGTFGQVHLIGASSALNDQFTVNNPNGPLLLDAGAGDNTINVVATKSAATINGQGGDDTFNVSSDAPTNKGTLDNINGALTLDGGSGTNTLYVSDYGQTAQSSNVTVTDSAITGFAGSSKGTAINYAAGTFSTVTLSGSNTVSDTFTVSGSTNAVLLANGGGDTFKLDDGASAISVSGGSGTDTLDYSAYTSDVNVTLAASSDANGYKSSSTPGLSGGFTGIDVLTAGQGTNTLTGENVASTWTLGSSAQTYNDGGSKSLTFSKFQTLDAGPAGDTFNINAAAAPVTQINGGAGNDTFNVNASATVNLNGNGGNNTYNLNSGGVLNGTIDGGSGSNTLNYASAVAVAVTGSDSEGYAGNDGGAFTGGWSDISTVNATGSGNSLTGENVASTWTIGSAPYTYDDGAGNGTLAFSNFETLNGGAAADTFNVSADDTQAANPITAINGNGGDDVFNLNTGGKLSAALDGGTGTDTLNYASVVAAVVTGSDSTGYAGNDGGSYTGGWTGIDAVNATSGNGSSLTGENVASTWTIGGSSQSYNDGSGALAFSGFDTVNAGTAGDTFNIVGSTDVTTANGGSGNDTFNVNASASLDLFGNGGDDTFNMADGATLTGTVNGGSGTDTLSYAAYDSSDPVAVSVSGSNANGYGGSGPGLSGFSGIDNLVGGPSTSDSLTGEDVASTWALGGSSQGYDDGAGNGSMTFSSFETVNAGSGGDTFNIVGSTDVTTANGGSGDDTFNVNASNTIDLNGKGGDDTFNMGDGVSLTGTIDGGTGKNTLSYAAYTTPVSVTLTDSSATTGFSSTSATGLTAFKGISTLVGGSATDTLTGEDKVSTWDIGSTQDYHDGKAKLVFSDFEQLQGGSAADTFNITSDTSAVTSINGGDGDNVFNVKASATMDLTGGAGDDTFNLSDGVTLTGAIDGGTGTNTLNYGDWTSDVTVVLGSDGTGYSSASGTTGVTSFKGINVLVGGSHSNDTLTGENVASTWTLADTQTYDDGAANGKLTFSAFEVLDSGTGNDTFNVTQTAAGVPLTLNGGGGDVTFNVSSLDNVAGDFTANGGSGTSNLNVDDSANTTSVGWVIESGDLQRFGSGIITYSNISGVTATTGTPTDGFSNALNVESVAAGVSVTVLASQTDVTVAQVSQDLSGIQGSVVIDAVGKNVTVTVYDSANTSDTTYTVNGATGTISTGTASIQVLESPTSVTVLGGSGTNTFDVTPSANFAISVDGGSGGNNTLTYETGGSTTWTDDGSTISDSTRGVQDVTYTDFTTVDHV